MSFDTLTFWLFFSLAWLFWRFLPFKIAKSVTIFMSLAFYGWWNPLYISLLLFCTLSNYITGNQIHNQKRNSARNFWLIISLLCNLGPLIFFKYSGFVAQSFAEIFKRGWDIKYSFQNIVIPVGISFYTFQAMTYTIDIYKRVLIPVNNVKDLFLYITFFPQLLAGHIVKAKIFLPQLSERNQLSMPTIQKGFYRIIWGLFMKIVIADNLAIFVNNVYNMSNLPTINPVSAWIGAIAFSIQIFADFAGYSAVAIGLACLMGLTFPENFNYPYISSSLREFWTRWHITLSNWLRDYLYIPLGGNRKGEVRTVANIIITMTICGFWHGGSWTYIAWGGLHGLGLAVERFFSKQKQFLTQDIFIESQISLNEAVKKLLRVIATYLFFVITLVFFRAESFKMASIMLYKMFICIFTEPLIIPINSIQYIILIIPVFLLHAGQLLHEWFGVRKNSYMRAFSAAVMMVLLIIV